MNAHDEFDLGAILRGHAGEGDRGPGLGLGDVQKKAGQIRRRRAAAAGAGVAAALAIIVPAALFGGGVIGGDAGDKEPGVLNSQTTDGEVSIQKGPALDVSDLPRGEAPKVLWLEGRTLHTPDGDVELGADNVQGLVPYDDGWMGINYDDSTGEPGLIFDAAGDVVDSLAMDSPPAASADGRYVLYIDAGALHLHDNETGTDRVIHESGPEIPDPVGVAMVLTPEVDTEPRLVAYYNLLDKRTGDLTPTTWSNGETQRIDGGDATETGNSTSAPYVKYLSVTPDGTFSAYTSIDDFGETCSAVFAGHGMELGNTCDYSLDTVSPDGTYTAGGPAYRSGVGDTSLALLTSEGLAPQVSYAISDSKGPVFMQPAVWEDDAHVLVPTFTFTEGQQGLWQILRIGVDGSVEDAIEPIPGTDATTGGIQLRLA